MLASMKKKRCLRFRENNREDREQDISEIEAMSPIKKSKLEDRETGIREHYIDWLIWRFGKSACNR